VKVALQGYPDMSSGQVFIPLPGWDIAQKLPPEDLVAEDCPPTALPATGERVLEWRSGQPISMLCNSMYHSSRQE